MKCHTLRSVGGSQRSILFSSSLFSHLAIALIPIPEKGQMNSIAGRGKNEKNTMGTSVHSSTTLQAGSKCAHSLDTYETNTRGGGSCTILACQSCPLSQRKLGGFFARWSLALWRLLNITQMGRCPNA